MANVEITDCGLFKVAEWQDRTGGVLRVERWNDGDVLIYSKGETSAVCLRPKAWKQINKFVKGGA